MSRVEELSDNHDHLAIAAAAESAMPIPSLPPHLSNTNKMSIDEVAADLKKSPFFMTSTDDTTDEDNVGMEAIRALMYEGTRAEIAEGFREQGNEMARAKKWADGKEFYTKGLAALGVQRKEEDSRGKEEDSRGKEEDSRGEEEDQREMKVREACLVNRALCHIELKNFRSCTLDCQSVLALAPTNVKASYRLSLALVALRKLPDALFACAAGLAHHPTNSALVALHAKISSQLSAAEALSQKQLEEEKRRKKEAETLIAAIKLRKITTRTTKNPPDLEDASICLVPDPLALATSTLTFPLLLLYPLHAKSDFIKAFGEEQSVSRHLGYLLPLPWDEKQEYSQNSIEAYMETKEGGLIKWGKKVPLLKVLSGGKVEIVDGIVRASLLPKARAEEWIQEMKTRKR
ncbi:hypothetical protein MMC26_007271 [Xylographa opegraphella]|nr:hypothetical protein [Xylographa opegraphella]